MNLTTFCKAAGLGLLFTLASAVADTDTFNDGNDDGWIRFSPLDVVGSSTLWTFPEDGSGGNAYRIYNNAPPVDAAGPARGFTYQEDVYTDFFAAVDILDWNNDVDQAFGFLFRASNVGLGQTRGYVMNYDPQQDDGGRGQIQFNTVEGEADTGTIAAANLSLEPGRQYRFTLHAVGDLLTGSVYDLEDLTTPIVSYQSEDSTDLEGIAGLFNFYRGGEPTDPDLGISDTTFDNYFIAASRPTNVAEPGIPPGFPESPVITDRTPASRAAFHPAAEGIQISMESPNSLAAGTFRLTLNGRDVSSGLNVDASGQTAAIQYDALSANMVYDARFTVTDENQNQTVSAWTFDTFEDSYLASDEVEIIEAEDYNFNSGEFIDNPAPSGFDGSGNEVNMGVGYLDRLGVLNIDYFDHSDQEGSGQVPEYRLFDFAGTQAGSPEVIEDLNFLEEDTFNDVIRQKYVDLGLTEYQVRATEGGEWLNYTRDFPEGEYNVFLRVTARASQEVFLDEVTGGASTENQSLERLGSFKVPNLGVLKNFRFVPLTDDQGDWVRVNMGGGQTVRLTLGGTQEDRTDGTIALNYLAFIPAPEESSDPFIVESAADVNGPYAPAANAAIGAQNIRVPMSDGNQFFRFRLVDIDPSAFSVLGASVEGGDFVIEYSAQ